MSQLEPWCLGEPGERKGKVQAWLYLASSCYALSFVLCIFHIPISIPPPIPSTGIGRVLAMGKLRRRSCVWSCMEPVFKVRQQGSSALAPTLSLPPCSTHTPFRGADRVLSSTWSFLSQASGLERPTWDGAPGFLRDS